MVRFPKNVRLESPCPSCGQVGLAPFYEVERISVQSNLLMPTFAEARACPTGDLRLASCDACGFITNTAFHPPSQQFTTQYEATQGFSRTFTDFIRSLARAWAARYDLRGKHALEIGCLKGEFIAMLCEEGGCTGIGIDPVVDPEHPLPDMPKSVRLISDRYDERYADLPADFICCRHTLEHIPDCGDFVRMVRRVVGTRNETIVCFEVPDTLRILQDGAFWDLYYEHCSYFTPGSLARLFRAGGFELLDLRRVFDEQYIVLESRPSQGPMNASLPLEQDLDECRAAINVFREKCAPRIEQWQRIVRDAVNANRRVALWGSGSKAVGFLTTLGITATEIPFVVDINPNKHDTYLPGTGQRIVAPEALREYKPDIVIAMNPIYRDEISADLVKMGIAAELLAL